MFPGVMLKKFAYIICLLLFFEGSSLLYTSGSDNHRYNLLNEEIYSTEASSHIPDDTIFLQRFNARVVSLNEVKDFNGLISFADSLKGIIPRYQSDSTLASELYYHIGVSLLLAFRYNEALNWLQLCVDYKEKLGITDNHYANGIYDIGVAYNHLGDFDQVTAFMHKYITLSSVMYGENSPEVAGAYSTLISASLEKNDYQSFRSYTFRTLEILNANKNALSGSELGRLYVNMGVGYAMLADYSKARIYLEEAESVYDRDGLERDQVYINLINSLALTYRNLGMTAKGREYYEMGMELAVSDNSSLSYNLINNFAVSLANSGMVSRGEEMVRDLVERSRKTYGSDSRYYIEALKNYAYYLSDYKNDYPNAILYYLTCLDYVDRNSDDIVLRESVYSGYAASLLRNGQTVEALDAIQKLLFYDLNNEGKYGEYDNPSLDQKHIDRDLLNTFRVKYEILKKLFSETNDQVVLENAAASAEIIISLIDRLRINISEEESRIILGNKYRDSYILAINDFYTCYIKTGKHLFLEKVFELAEKSKAVGLMAATREMNAANFQIPSGIAGLETSLQRDIAYYNSEINKENGKEKPNRNLLSEYNNKLLEAVKIRDSLVMTFERDYPGYFAIKYTPDVISADDVPDVTGRNTNYINYVVSDSILYIILVNRKYEYIHTARIDTVFFNKILSFRRLLSGNNLSVNARSKFETFISEGYSLYHILVEPVSKYFISGDLVISPDNILSYIPFETLLSSDYTGEGIQYRRLPYLMNNYSISYTYSASFMKETMGRNYGKRTRLIAFAPVYTREIYIDSISVRRDGQRQILYDLPYARQEAEYVAGISSGTLYSHESARESVFKSEAGKYDIIHLAMHTWLNDQDPMISAMIFSQGNDLPEDGLLNTFEVYGIPIKAKMVVLSSCNTGSGLLSSGEGILSLARGFIYSGSQSVVMSMWEIEDRSGTEIVKMFYDELRKGKTKSMALKKARTEYLRNAGQLKSHPYFWSSLVVYGDNSPVYVNPLRTLIPALIALAVLITAYLLYRRYS